MSATGPQQADGASPILEAQELTVCFQGEDGSETVAVDGFSLTIRPGEFVGIMGEPGCGKSTAAIALLGLGFFIL